MDKKQKKNGVFMMRGEGQTFEQFKTALMKRFEDEGLFEEDEQPANEPDEDQLRIHRLMEADLPRLIAQTQHPQNSMGRPKAVNITGVYYSKERLPVISSKYYGKGSPDEEGQD
jgi:hypothetical protein